MQLLYLLLIAAWILSIPATVPSQIESPSQSNLVHYGDLIEVDVIGSFDYDWRGSLTPEGYLDGLDAIPEQVYALCRTEEDLSATIQKALSKALQLREPKVTVRILDRSNRAVAFFTGAVRSPQRFQIKRPIRLNELIVMSGGITDRSNGEIQIFRPANLSCVVPRKNSEAGDFVKASQPGGAGTTTIRIGDILRGDPDSNPLILSGDIVTASEALPVYVIGGVKSPQQIPLRNQLTLSRVISMAGGLADDDIRNVKIFRRDGKETRIIDVDLQKIGTGPNEDPVLKAFDVVDVPEKGKPQRTRPPLIDGQSAKSTSLATLPLRIID